VVRAHDLISTLEVDWIEFNSTFNAVCCIVPLKKNCYISYDTFLIVMVTRVITVIKVISDEKS